MFAATTGATRAQLPTSDDGQRARAVAADYLNRISAYWRGERSSISLDLPVLLEPVEADLARGRRSDARSPHAAGGRGISWFEIGPHVVGVIPGSDLGYRIRLAPRDVDPPGEGHRSAIDPVAPSSALGSGVVLWANLPALHP
jgi:hypothetical protein